MSNNIFSEDFNISAENFNSEDFKGEQRRIRAREAMKKNSTAKTNSSELSDEASTYAGLTIFKFFFVTIPLALLLAGLAVQPLFEVAWGIDLGFWTAFFLLMTLRWLIPRPRKAVPLEKLYAKRGK